MNNTRRVKAQYIIVLSLLLPACASVEEKTRKAFLLNNEAQEAYLEGRCEQAIKLYQQLSENLPKNTESLLRVGNCYARNKQPEQAVDAYKAAISRDPSYVKAWYNLSYLQAKELALTVAKMSAIIDPNDSAMASTRRIAEQVLDLFNSNGKDKPRSYRVKTKPLQQQPAFINTPPTATNLSIISRPNKP